MKILIKNGRVWDGEQFFHADVLTENSVIATIAPQISEKADYTFDAEGMTVSAGLVDCHMHFAGISSPSYAICPEMGCLPFGVTAAADAGGTRGSSVVLDRFAVKALVFADSVIENDCLNETATYRHIRMLGKKCVGIKLFYDATSPKLKTIRGYIDGKNPACELEVDGGIDPVTCKTVIENGANVLVAGSAVYKAADIPARIAELRG